MTDFLVFLEVVLDFVPAVAGGAIAIAALVDAGKKLGLVKPGYAQLASLALNAILFVVLYFLGDIYQAEIDSVLSAIVQLSPVVVALLLSLKGTQFAHKVLSGIGLGYRH